VIKVLKIAIMDINDLTPFPRISVAALRAATLILGKGVVTDKYP